MKQEHFIIPWNSQYHIIVLKQNIPNIYTFKIYFFYYDTPICL